MLTVDLNTRVLSQDHQVFFARPGHAYRLYPEFVEHRAVFAELPLLDLTQGVPIEQQPRLNARIHRSRAIRSWYAAGRPEHRVPSRELDDYPDGLGDRGVSQIRGSLLGLFGRARVGDLVVVSPKAYSLPALVGEFTDEAGNYVTHRSEKYGRQEFLTGRSVRWLGRTTRRKLPARVNETVTTGGGP
jgi:hypothetical protein